MKKFFKTRLAMIVSLVIGIMGYVYIMGFRSPGVLEISVLIFFTLLIRFSSGYLLNKNYKKVKILDYINKQYNGFLEILDLLYPIVITLLLFFGMNRKF